MADPIKPKPPAEKEAEVHKTREKLKGLGLPDDHTPEPQREDDKADLAPNQSATQPGGGVIKDKLRKLEQTQ